MYCSVRRWVGELIIRQSIYAVGLFDVRTAHGCAKASREIYVELPEECGEGKDKVGRLNASMYGTQDASQHWEYTVFDFMDGDLNCEQGKSSPCLYYQEGRDLRSETYGDDVATGGGLQHVQWFHERCQENRLVMLRSLGHRVSQEPFTAGYVWVESSHGPMMAFDGKLIPDMQKSL